MLPPELPELEAGDEGMWGCAFYWLWPVACSAAHRHLSNLAAAETEDVAIGAIREAAEMVHAGRVGSFEELKALTGVIAARRALDLVRRLRAMRRAQEVTESMEGHEDLAIESKAPWEETDALDLARLLTDLMARLTEKQRRLLKLYYLDGKTQPELATELSIPLGTIGVTLSRALDALRQELRRHPRLMKELLEALR
jgi:RNA polymerase sigma factor (sigma-70 family)